MTAPGESDGLRVTWQPGEGPQRALTFERIDSADQWVRREWRRTDGQWQIVGSEPVDELAVANAAAVGSDE